mmetsp:Transcript_27277/g.68877  ORF Transcript_27277/g.68877 Transcript_27277/m.68877 type:complete len:308 (+) Transcript_27277:374-1297(+)
MAMPCASSVLSNPPEELSEHFTFSASRPTRAAGPRSSLTSSSRPESAKESAMHSHVLSLTESTTDCAVASASRRVAPPPCPSPHPPMAPGPPSSPPPSPSGAVAPRLSVSTSQSSKWLSVHRDSRTSDAEESARTHAPTAAEPGGRELTIGRLTSVRRSTCCRMGRMTNLAAEGELDGVATRARAAAGVTLRVRDVAARARVRARVRSAAYAHRARPCASISKRDSRPSPSGAFTLQCLSESWQMSASRNSAELKSVGTRSTARPVLSLSHTPSLEPCRSASSAERAARATERAAPPTRAPSTPRCR